MSERMPAGSGLWWELLVMRGGTRCEHWLPKGRQINYSAGSLASTWLRWQHMRGIHLCNIHERTRRCLKAMSWVRGAHMHVERQIPARNGRIADCYVTVDIFRDAGDEVNNKAMPHGLFAPLLLILLTGFIVYRCRFWSYVQTFDSLFRNNTIVLLSWKKMHWSNKECSS